MTFALTSQRTRLAKRNGRAGTVVVYTREAYLADPDLQQPEEAEERARIEASDATHVIVAVLAFAGPKSPLPPNTFLHNLAGGNHEALSWTADEIRSTAQQVKAYWNEWCVVAD